MTRLKPRRRIDSSKTALEFIEKIEHFERRAKDADATVGKQLDFGDVGFVGGEHDF